MNLFQKVREWFGLDQVEFEPEPVEVLEGILTKAEFLQSMLDEASSADEPDVEEIRELTEQIADVTEERVQMESEMIKKAIEFTALLPKNDQDQLKYMLDKWALTGELEGEKTPYQVVVITKAVDIIAKGGPVGEGSRGGHVIGHTRNGHPIYFSQQNHDYSHFTSHDHMDAADLHAEERDKYPIGHEVHEHHDIMHSWHKRKALHQEVKWEKTEGGMRGTVTGEAANFLTRNYWPFAKGEGNELGELDGHYANVILKNKEGKILFLKRADDKVVAPGQYCLPGGHIDAGETLTQAAARELKEEANMTCTHLTVVGKAMCDDGKWAFYLVGGLDDSNGADLALLDNENKNAAWMSPEEWMQADLFFDLKDHLIAIEMPSTRSLNEIPTITKGIEMSKEDFEKEHERLIDILENGSEKERKEEAKRQKKERKEKVDKAEEIDIEKGQFYGGKKGEGSRGGRIIGHTHSGRPVYARLSGGDTSYKKFSADDHKQAAAHHRSAAEAASKHYGNTDQFWHTKRAEEHEHQANNVKKAEEDGVIGYTRGGEPIVEEIEKGGKRGVEGEIRTWKGVKYQKRGKRWFEMTDPHKKRPMAVKDVVAHAENTSTGRLKEVSKDEKHPHNDAAKRELERRKTEKEKGKPKVPAAGAASAQAAAGATDKPKRKKKKKELEYESNKHLTDPRHKRIEKEFGKELQSNPEKAFREYFREFGNILNTDNVRELSAEYRKDRSLAAAVHEPASSLVKYMYGKMLKEEPPAGKEANVLFTAGGTGAGKTSGIGEHPTTRDAAQKAQIVYDTNMNSMKGIDKIEQAFRAGKKVDIVHTYRDPYDAFVNGAVPRAQRMELGETMDLAKVTDPAKRKEIQSLVDNGTDKSYIARVENAFKKAGVEMNGWGSGRTVPIGTHVATHNGANESIPRMAEYYKGNPDISFTVIDNSRGWGKSEIVPIDFLKDKKVDANELVKKANDYIDKLYEQGGISERLYKGFKAAGD